MSCGVQKKIEARSRDINRKIDVISASSHHGRHGTGAGQAFPHSEGGEEKSCKMNMLACFQSVQIMGEANGETTIVQHVNSVGCGMASKLLCKHARRDIDLQGLSGRSCPEIG